MKNRSRYTVTGLASAALGAASVYSTKKAVKIAGLTLGDLIAAVIVEGNLLILDETCEFLETQFELNKVQLEHYTSVLSLITHMFDYSSQGLSSRQVL